MERASSICNSATEHRRAPPISQKFKASCQLSSPEQEPRLWSLSPQTLELPNDAALVQPRSLHEEAETVTGTAGDALGFNVGRKDGPEVGATTG